MKEAGRVGLSDLREFGSNWGTSARVPHGAWFLIRMQKEVNTKKKNFCISQKRPSTLT